MYTHQELENMARYFYGIHKKCMFLSIDMYDKILDQFIIIVNNQNLENIQIYSLNDLETCISPDLKLPKIYESKDIKFN